MSVNTVGLFYPEIVPVSNYVSLVIPQATPVKIIYMVVFWIVVPVESERFSFRRGSQERFTD